MTYMPCAVSVTGDAYKGSISTLVGNYASIVQVQYWKGLGNRYLIEALPKLVIPDN